MMSRVFLIRGLVFGDGYRLLLSFCVSVQTFTKCSKTVHLFYFYALLEVLEEVVKKKTLLQPTNKTGYPTLEVKSWNVTKALFSQPPCLTPTAQISKPVKCPMTHLNVIYHQFQPSIVVDPDSSVRIKLRVIISMTCLAVLRDSLNIKEPLISSNPAC